MPAHRAGKTYVESLLSQRGTDGYQAETTLWHDGRVSLVLRNEGRTMFMLSFYPAATNKWEHVDAVYVDHNTSLLASRERAAMGDRLALDNGLARSVTVDAR